MEMLNVSSNRAVLGANFAPHRMRGRFLLERFELPQDCLQAFVFLSVEH